MNQEKQLCDKLEVMANLARAFVLHLKWQNVFPTRPGANRLSHNWHHHSLGELQTSHWRTPRLVLKSHFFAQARCAVFSCRGSCSFHQSKPTLCLRWLYNPFYRHQQSAQYSTKPDKRKVKHLMVATYVSATIGIVLLTAVGYRFYGRFQKRARGIEELDAPAFGRRSRFLCRYRGYVLPSSIIGTIVNDIPWFQVREDDIWVVSYPKAGTTWLQEIVYLISTGLDYEKARATTIDKRFPFLEFPYPGLKVIADMGSPRFIKSHLPFSLLPKQVEEKKPKVIYIARNPKDTAVSLMAFIKLSNVATFTGTIDDFSQLFVDGTALYGPWQKHVQEGWERRHDDNILFVTYEDLHKDFRGTVQEIASFLGKPLPEWRLAELEEHCCFQGMQHNDSVNYSWMRDIWKEGNFMRKGQVGDWKNHLSPEISAKMDSLMVSLEPMGLQFVDS